jgi:phage/plasmid-like protein (TIGR03299 family)
MNIEVNRYAGATPWDGKGEFVGDKGETAVEALRGSAADFTVSKHRVFTQPCPNWTTPEIEVENYRAVVRDDTKQVLGMPGKNFSLYQPLQFAQFADDIAMNGDMKVHTIGVDYGGARIWMLCKIGSTEIVPEDKVDHYLFLVNGFDGKTALQGVFTNVREVCANAFRAAVGKAKGEVIRIRHTKNMVVNPAEARRVLRIGQKAFEESDDFMKTLAETPMPTSDWIDLCLTIFPNPVADENGEYSKRGTTRAENNRRTLTSLYYDGRGARIPGVHGTAWGAYNAITEYAGYHRQTRGNQRFESLMMGSGADFVRSGTNLLRELV